MNEAKGRSAHYIRLLWWILPSLRSDFRRSRVRRLLQPGLGEEAELVHNIPALLETDGYSEQDVHWLNTQARNYLRISLVKRRPFHAVVVESVRAILCLMPEHLLAGVCDEVREVQCPRPDCTRADPRW